MIRCLGVLLVIVSMAQGGQRPPNVVIVFTDDQGYADLGCYGHPTIRTPHLDRMAAEGMKLSQFYVASPVCSPSRAALLTGCYPKRVGMHEHVIYPEDDHGLHPDEVTIADMLSANGYATACVGKWHLGHRPGLLPTSQGFDAFYGVAYSNDMSRVHRKADSEYPHRLPLIRDETVIEWEPDQRYLTRRYTEAAVAFIERHADEPFFLYMPHSMPHIPLYVSDAFEGRSARGLYGDVIEEIDWSVGEIRAALERAGVAEDTLFVFTSDNGPWLPFKERGGSAGPLRGGKGSTWEGGQRVPCIVWWPGHIEGGVVRDEVITTMDLLPTIAAITGAALPEREIDGIDVSSVLVGEGGAGREHFAYYTSRGALAGVRRGAWKLLLEGPKLYNVEVDISEQWDRAGEQPELVEALTALAMSIDADIEAGARPVMHVDAAPWQDSVPRILLLGDSISMGYHATVVEALREEAIVERPKENCAGTTKGVGKIDAWLALEGGDFDIIHFNFGLHDLKRVQADGRNSNDPDDARQADLEAYRANLIEIVDALEATGATLIFATTTPFPSGVRPHRDPEDAARYNEAAVEIMRSRGIGVDDLYAFAQGRLEEIQQPVNVHFTREGSALLGEQVVRSLRAAMVEDR